MLSAPWIKRIELQTGAKTSMPLRADAHFPTARVTHHKNNKFTKHTIYNNKN